MHDGDVGGADCEGEDADGFWFAVDGGIGVQGGVVEGWLGDERMRGEVEYFDVVWLLVDVGRIGAVGGGVDGLVYVVVGGVVLVGVAGYGQEEGGMGTGLWLRL